MSSEPHQTRTGGRAATEAVVKGRHALSVGRPEDPPVDGWSWTPLTEVAQLETGHTPSRRRPDWWDGDIPWIGIKDATQNHGRLIADTFQHTNEEGVANSSARLLPAHTVCLSRTASVGYVVVMGKEMATSQDFVNWVCDPKQLDWRYLRWVLMAEKESFLRFASGTTHQTIYFPEVKAFHVCLPSIEEQRRIAGVLGALDDAANQATRTGRRLNTLAETLFEQALRTQEDWIEGDLTDLARFVNGKNFTKGAVGTGRPVLRIKELRGGVNDATVRTETDADPNFIADHFDLLFAWSGTLGVHRWDGPQGLVNQHIFKVIPHEGIPLWFVECWLQRHIKEFVAIARDKATTMGHIQRRHLSDARVAIPIEEAFVALDATIGPLDALREIKAREAAHLREMRDALLPKLIGGDLRVSEHYLGDVDDPVTV